jgi:deoxyribodipyrimidine photo-lyase
VSAAARQAGGGVAIAWFRRDLRVHDHAALTAAVARAEAVVPLFVVDDRLLAGRFRSPDRIAFMLSSARALGESLGALGAPLVVARGDPRRIVPELASALGAGEVHVTRDLGPYGIARDAAVAVALATDGRALCEHRGAAAAEPEEVRTADGRPYTVHGPFRKRWEAVVLPPLLPPPARIAALDPGGLAAALDRAVRGAAAGAGADRLLADLLRGDVVRDAGARDVPAPGEAAARTRLERWLGGGLAEYDRGRDLMGTDGTSRLSQDLRWGLLSPAEVRVRAEAAGTHASGGPGARAFVGELSWRDFYVHALAAFPGIARGPYRPGADPIGWRDDPAGFAAWQEGRTGFPVVDAAMRQLAATGWMHNRARMVVASFLVKDLLVDWREGERHFMRLLVDGDVASNAGGWQWIAACGPDAQPWFRILDPVAQGRRFDPDGAYVRRWVPELAALGDRVVHAPWEADETDLRSAGVRLGRDYPERIVDRRMSRARALAAYDAVRRPSAGSA